MVGPPIAPPEVPEPLVVAPPEAPIDLGMDINNEENPEEDVEEGLIEPEEMIDPDWPPGGLPIWMTGDTLYEMSILDDAPPVEDQEEITSDSETDEGIEIYWEILRLLSKLYM